MRRPPLWAVLPALLLVLLSTSALCAVAPQHAVITTLFRQAPVLDQPAAPPTPTPSSISPSVQPTPSPTPGPASPSPTPGPASPSPTASTSPSPGSSVSPSPSSGLPSPSAGLPPPQPPPGEQGTILALLTASASEFDSDGSDYDLLSRAVAAVNYNGVLSSAHGGKGVTLLAPADSAFVQTARDLGYLSNDERGAYEAIIRVLSNITNNEPLLALYDIIGYHVVPTAFNRQLLVQRSPLSTYQGASIVVQGTELQHIARALPNPKLVGGSAMDVVADNGMVHGIDRLLFPFNVDVELARNIINSIVPPPLDSSPNNATGTQEQNETGGAICFPASATVSLADGRLVRIGTLKAGMRVRVDGDMATSAVFAFTHRKMDGVHEFVRIETNGHAVTLSEMHYVYANEALVRARDVQVGDILRTISGRRSVSSVCRVFENGLIAPHTMQGDIVVGGVVASTYTALFSAEAAHALLAPVRAVVRAGVAEEPLGDVFYNGRPRRPSVTDLARRFLGVAPHSVTRVSNV